MYRKPEEKIAEIEKFGILAAGKNNLIKHLKGQRLTQREAIHAFCYDCMGFYADGKGNCGDPLCPLYPYNAYNKKTST